MEESRAGADRQSILQFMTTEHFTLQTARGVANAEKMAPVHSTVMNSSTARPARRLARAA